MDTDGQVQGAGSGFTASNCLLRAEAANFKFSAERL